MCKANGPALNLKVLNTMRALQHAGPQLVRTSSQRITRSFSKV